MMFKKKCVGFLVALFISTPLMAQEGTIGGLFVEPLLTYEIGDTSINYPAPIGNGEGSANGFGVGARLGVHLYEAFFVGAEGRFAMPKFKDDPTGYEANAIAANYGVVVGMQMPDIGLRVWGAYILDGRLNPDEDAGFDVNFKSGTGFRVGAGFRVAAVSINLEYQDLTYGTAELEQVGSFAPGTEFSSVELENKSWVASVSFPLEI